MEVTGTRSYGCQSMTAPLRRVLVRRPADTDIPSWEAYGWRAAPDPAGLAAEHEEFCATLEEAGAEVIVCRAPAGTGIDTLYAYDPALVGNEGAILLRPGKAIRRGEVETMAGDLATAGVPIAARVEAPATVEGGDTLWLDERTLLVGLGYRTNEAGAAALAAALPGVDVITLDLPHFRGPGEVLHLMSFISPLAEDLAVVYLPLMPVRLVELLSERGIALVEVPDPEFGTMGPNVLALAPRVALALEGNDETRRRLERAGVEVLVYKGAEISRKGDGGPTCLTRPILRG
jgi:N-dimethylarginine dimethylaminohydrolase